MVRAKNTKTFLLILGLGILTVLLYTFKLGFTPIYLNQDEMAFSMSSYLIAHSLRDASGRFLPFYFWQLGSLWSTPVIVYLGALFLRFLPLTEVNIRLAGVIVGVSSIGLITLVAHKIFASRRLTMVGFFLALTTPVLFINSRVLLDCIFPVLFVCLWLLMLHNFWEKGNGLFLFLAGLFLGIGFHSYHAAKIMMPIYFLTTIAFLFVSKKLKFMTAVLVTMGFMLPIVVFIPWLIKYPDTLLNQVSYIGSIDKSVQVGSGLLGVFNLERLQSFVTNYFTYLSPKILFIEGDRSLIHSTGRVGAFVFPVAMLLVFGILKVLKDKENWFGKLLLFGFLTYPVAPSIVNDPQRISRGLVVIPFIVLLGVYGFNFLYNQKDRIFRWLLAGILALNAVLFVSFLADYFGNYRVRSWWWFNGNIGGMYESIIKSTKIRDVNFIYLDQNIYFARDYFEWYKVKLGAQGLSEILFDPRVQDFTDFPRGSIVALRAADVLRDKSQRIGDFEKIEILRESDGTESFLIYYRDVE